MKHACASVSALAAAFLVAATTASATETVDPHWLIVDVAVGVTPAFVFDSDDRVHLLWFSDDAADHAPLWIARAGSPRGPFDPEVLAEGYFYGPGAMLAAPGGDVHFFWHDHVGKPRHFVRAAAGGVTEYVIDSPGSHDGWDGSLALGDDGRLHVSALFPVLHGAVDSLEYGIFDGASWSYELVAGSGLSMYGLNTSLALDGAGRPHVLYCRAEGRDLPGDLVHAVAGPDGWEFGTVVEGGLRGRFPSLAIDRESDRVHAIWLDLEGASLEEGAPVRALVRYGVLDGNGWEVETVTLLERVGIGFCDSRLPVSLVLDSDQRVQIALCDARSVVHGVRTDAGWELVEVVTSASDLYMGVAQLALDSRGIPTVALWQRDGTSPAGMVRLATLRTDDAVFHRGDPNETGVIDVSDAVVVFTFLFVGGAGPSCRESADVNNSGQVDISDGVAILNFLFGGGPPPALPGPTSRPCGPDPDASGSAGALGCDSYTGC